VDAGEELLFALGGAALLAERRGEQVGDTDGVLPS
jgi:hypothetical protein